MRAAFALALVAAAALPVEPPRFSEHLIRGGYGYAYGIAAADLGGGRPNLSG
ncbi:MAG: hypothetical protein ACRC33_30325 [Gemmataceae bacterium]